MCVEERERYSLHHGCRYGAAVLDGRERRREVGGVRGLHHLFVPVHHVQVAVELLPDLLGQLRKDKHGRRLVAKSGFNLRPQLFHVDRISFQDQDRFHFPGCFPKDEYEHTHTHMHAGQYV